jgi:exopolyphosphatase/pppGpp-phosphohydrolase
MPTVARHPPQALQEGCASLLPSSPLAPAGPARVLLSGGTATTLAAWRLRLPYYERAAVQGASLTAVDLRAAGEELSVPAGVAAARAQCPWLTEARASTLAAGCAGLLGLLQALGAREAEVSDADGLDGLLAELLADASRLGQRP